MNVSRLLRVAGLAALCLAAAAFAGLPWADASSSRHPVNTGRASPPSKVPAGIAGASPGCLPIRYDLDDTPYCLAAGPTGPRGYRGFVGALGPQGGVGPVGALGPIGALGRQGPTGPQGIQGIQGIQGPPGAFQRNGSVPGGNLYEVLGSKIGPLTITNTSPATGTELTPSVARCPTSGPDQQAFDGGAQVTLAAFDNQGNPIPAVGDVVGLESSYPGLYTGPVSVAPLPLGATPGTVSTQTANAYEAQAVITKMNFGDQVTVQAYVICGP